MVSNRLRIPSWAVLTAAAFVAILPMLFQGVSCGHDFDFHLLSWLEAANQFASFHYPHWAFTPAWNAGEPRFIFYPPLSWALGGLLGLMLPWTFVPVAFTWIALAVSGVTMYRLASRFASPNAALLAATLYLANPYMLFTAYERTAYGELLAAAWIPLLFAAALAPRIRILQIAIPLALIWLTNAPAGVMSSYALAFLIVIRLYRKARHSERGDEPLHFAVRSTAGTLLAFALAAFYIIPAAYEQRFVEVNMATTAGMRPVDHFLFHHMPPGTLDGRYHDQVVQTASIVAMILLALIALAAAVTLTQKSCHRSRNGRRASVFLPLLLLAILIVFLLTTPSLFLWNHVPKLAFLQFPWRLCALLAVILATLTAQALDRLPLPSPGAGSPANGSGSLGWRFPLPLALLLVLPAWHFFHLRCDDEDAIPARVALFHEAGGTEPTDEYTPVGADNDALKQNNPPYWLVQPDSPDTQAPAPCDPRSTGCRPISHLVLNQQRPVLLIVNLRAYPSWQVTLNGRTEPSESARTDGLITVNLPTGTDTIDITDRLTSDQSLGLTMSSLAALLALAIAGKSAPPAAKS